VTKEQTISVAKVTKDGSSKINNKLFDIGNYNRMAESKEYTNQKDLPQPITFDFSCLSSLYKVDKFSSFPRPKVELIPDSVFLNYKRARKEYEQTVEKYNDYLISFGVDKVLFNDKSIS
jgi:hypothetical protein